MCACQVQFCNRGRRPDPLRRMHCPHPTELAIRCIGFSRSGVQVVLSRIICTLLGEPAGRASCQLVSTAWHSQRTHKAHGNR